MIRPTGIAAAILAATAIPALAQVGNPSPASRDTRPPTVIGQTGTMYDGNNADLRLPTEPNAYWARLWAELGARPATPALPRGSASARPALGSGALKAGASIDERHALPRRISNRRRAGGAYPAALVWHRARADRTGSEVERRWRPECAARGRAEGAAAEGTLFACRCRSCG